MGIGTDGIMPMVKGELKGIDNLIFKGNEITLQMAIKSQRQSFFDDVTIGTFEGGNYNGAV